MFRPVLVALLLVSVVAAISRECDGHNEEWSDCYLSGPPGCREPTCWYREPRDDCKPGCKQGCVCKKGYYRHDHLDLCMIKQHCPGEPGGYTYPPGK